MEKVFEIYIKTTPGAALGGDHRPEMRAKYSFGVGVKLRLDDRARLRGRRPAGVGIEIAEGENLEVDPPRRLVQSFTALWSDEVKSEGPSRVTWEIEPVGDSCRLTVTHDQLREGANDELYGGWPMILSGLKTLLETGELLDTPGSLRYSGPGARKRGRDACRHAASTSSPCRPRTSPRRWSSTRTCSVSSPRRAAGREEPLGAEFETGHLTIAVMQPDAFGLEFQAQHAPIAFQVDDFEAARAELESRGVEFVATRSTAASATWPFEDPDGNALVMHHRYAPKGDGPQGNARPRRA